MDEQGKALGGSDLKPLFNALVILLLTGIFVQQLPLGDSRPAPAKEHRAAAGIKLDARLWADPFESPREDLKQEPKHATNFGDFGGQVATRVIGSLAEHKVVIMPVMVDGGPYFESVEARRRTRYAVVSGLAAAGYEPEDAESIQYLHYPDPYRMHDPLEAVVLSAAERQFPDIVPYEWFEPAAGKHADAPVLVLWLQENHFAARPLEKLGVLASQLRYYAMRSVYRSPSPETPPADGAGCIDTMRRPTLVAQEFAQLFRDLGLTDPKQYPPPEVRWAEWRQFLHDDLPDDPSDRLARYLKLLPLALWLREDTVQTSDVELLRREIQGLTRVAAAGRDLEGKPRSGTAGHGSSHGGVICDVPYDSFLFQLLRERAPDFLDTLGARLKRAAAATSQPLALPPGIAVADAGAVFDAASFDFRILGPASSNLLTAMLSELRPPRGDRAPGRDTRYLPFHFYSASASADETLLAPPDDRTQCSQDKPWVECAFEAKGMSFVRTIATDNRLAEGIRDELRRRGVPLGRETNPVVLIAEWDRVYTQKLRETFCEALRGEHGVADCSGSPRRSGSVVVYSYLRGLDGEGAQKFKPNDEKGKRDKGANGQSASLANLLPAGGASYPWGNDQVDYLQRMASDLKIYEDRLRAGGGARGIRAIGLLGSDVYDKLLIMKALKPQFPEALFFTTDLDARLMNGAGDGAMTQNLVIASSWGLQLHPDWQRDIPPFRSVYQTSYFLATQIAMKPLEWQHTCNSRLQLEPQLFEVGRTGFVELNSGERRLVPRSRSQTDCDLSNAPGSMAAQLHVGAVPAPEDRTGVAVWLGLLMGLLAVGCLMRTACREVGPSCNVRAAIGGPETRGRFILTGAVALWALLILALFVRSEEPFVLAEGVSIWPTEMIRGAAYLLVVFYFWPRSLEWLAPLRADLQQHGLLADNSAPWPLKGVGFYVRNVRFWAALLALSAALLAVQLGGQSETFRPWRVLIPSALSLYVIVASFRASVWTLAARQRGTAETLLDELYMNGVDPRRDERIRVFMVAFLAISISLISAFGLPLAPYRGIDALLADCFVLDAAIIAYLGLLAVVIDTTRSVNAHLRQLADASEFACAPSFAAVWGIQPGLAVPWLKVLWAGIVTKHVSRLIVYPFVIAAMLALARNRLFDDWSLPVGLILVFALSFGYLLFCSWSLKRASADIRDRELAALRLAATRARHQGDDASVGKINDVIGKIESYREGSYASIFARPMFKGLLLLAGGGGAEFVIPMLLNLF